MSDSTNDLTRWNRAGLPRFRYVDGNAATWLEELRLALLTRNLAPLLDPNQPDPAGRFDWWEKTWRTPPADSPGQTFVKQVLDQAEQRLLWKGPDGSGPLWVRPPVRPELETDWSTRLREQYEAGRGDLAWEMVRSFARGVHLLTEHLDAYANEGYLGTATQWENVRRLIAMLDVRPAPPASASTVLVLEAKGVGTVGKGFQVKHSPADGGAPVIFETLEDLEVDPVLDALRPLDHDRNPEAVQGSRIELDGRVKGLRAGEPLVLEDERSGDLHAYLIQSVSEGETVTRVEVAPAVKSGLSKGWALVHAVPRERLAPLAPASRGAEVGKTLHLTEEPLGLQPGDVVWISDGHQPVYRRVEQVRGRRLILDAEIGELRADLTVVGRPIALPVTDVGGREVKRDSSGNLEATILAIRVAGDWTRLANEWLADKRVSGSGQESLPLFQVISADYRPVGSVINGEGQLDPNGGYTVLRLQWTHKSGLANPQALLAPPPGGGLWRADRFLEKSYGKLPAEITSALPKKAAAGDVAVVASGSTLAWTRLAAIEADADAGTALLRADEGGWRDRGGGPFFLAETRVFTKFERSARVVGWSANATPVSGTEIPLPAELLGASAALRPGRTVVVELDDQPAGTSTPAMTARVLAVSAAVSTRNGGELTLDRALPAGARRDNLVLRANAVLAGHGEAQDERALGSGDASRSRQTFRFEETGVSFVADPGQPSGVRAAIEVRIGNRVWQQVPTLADSGPADPHYTVRMTEDGGVELTFGDGRNGRRLPTGVNNVRLAWRSGSGLAGNLPAGRLVKAARPHPLVAAVRQPLPATGGNDMQGVESMRATAPASVSTLGRAVSLADYGRLAASQSSVWQAAAFALPTGLARKDSVRVVVVPAGGGQLGALAGQVRAFLEAHALPGVSIRVDPYRSLGFALRVELQIVTAEFDPERVADTVRARLLAAFGLRARKLGQALRLSEVFRVVEGVPGVANSLCVLDNDPKKARVDAPADGVVHLDAATSSLTILHREFEL